jgi:hypothetical protein
MMQGVLSDIKYIELLSKVIYYPKKDAVICGRKEAVTQGFLSHIKYIDYQTSKFIKIT